MSVRSHPTKQGYVVTHYESMLTARSMSLISLLSSKMNKWGSRPVMYSISKPGVNHWACCFTKFLTFGKELSRQAGHVIIFALTGCHQKEETQNKTISRQTMTREISKQCISGPTSKSHQVSKRRNCNMLSGTQTQATTHKHKTDAVERDMTFKHTFPDTGWTADGCIYFSTDLTVAPAPVATPTATSVWTRFRSLFSKEPTLFVITAKQHARARAAITITKQDRGRRCPKRPPNRRPRLISFIMRSMALAVAQTGFDESQRLCAWRVKIGANCLDWIGCPWDEERVSK